MSFRRPGRGQVSTEMLVAVLILFVFMLVVFFQNSIFSNSTENVSTVYVLHGECLRLAFATSKVYSEGPGASLSFELDQNAQIISSAKSVFMGEDYCRFLARTGDYSLSKGTITLSNNNGVVVFS